jgi:hypothetical protein
METCKSLINVYQSIWLPNGNNYLIYPDISPRPGRTTDIINQQNKMQTTKNHSIMKSKSLQKLKNNMLRMAILPLLVVCLMLGASVNANAQKYELTGVKSQITQATEITLSNSTVNKFYYLFRVDDANKYHFVTFMVGQGFPLKYAPQETAGKYVVYEFDNFMEMPFNFEKYKPTDGVKQTGEITVTVSNN